MLKKIVSFVMALSLCTALFITPAFADDLEIEVPTEVGELSDSVGNISVMSYSSVKTALSISGTKATCTTVVTGYATTTSISIYMYLERYINGSWTTYSSWSSSTSNSTATLSKTATVTKGYTYRVRASVYGYGSSTKHETYYSSQVSI